MDSITNHSFGLEEKYIGEFENYLYFFIFTLS